MAGILIQHKVKDYGIWKKVYDSQIALRKSSGALSDQIYRDVMDPNKLTVIFKWNTLENAQKFTKSPELLAAMELAGVEGQPSITFLNEA